jgi:hypothetical protein
MPPNNGAPSKSRRGTAGRAFDANQDVHVCGKLLNPEDRKLWRQALGILLELRIRNGIDEKEFSAEVSTVLIPKRGARGFASTSCEDCRLGRKTCGMAADRKARWCG